MVDVGDKSVTRRRAVAEGWIVMQPETLKMIQKGDHKKGDVLSVARIAGIMAAKKTAELIPLCHPLMLTSVTVELEIQESSQAVRCEVASETTERTGVENGGAYCAAGCAADDIRYVQSGGSRNGNSRCTIDT